MLLIAEIFRNSEARKANAETRAGRLVAMDSSVPPVSGVAWAGLSTGVNPGRHGIFGFTELRPGTYDLRFPNATRHSRTSRCRSRQQRTQRWRGSQSRHHAERA